MEHRLRYGQGHVSVALPRGRCVARLEPVTPEPAAPPRELLRRALENPIGGPRLRDIARGRKTAAILIPGKARLAGTRDYVPALVDELNAGGIADGDIEVFLADGTHDQHLGQDVIDLLGEDTVKRVRCVGHNPKDEANLTKLGTTSRGTPVLFNKRVLGAGVRVLTGRIVPHYFAGYSGGRKAMIPGVAGFPTILANHRLTLDPVSGIRAGVGLCSPHDNAIHLDMLEGVRMVQPEFCLNTLMDAKHRLVSVVAGHFERAHEEGCRRAERMYRLTLPEPVDAVITSAGGLPYDTNFMQSIKAVFNVQDIVKPGGAVLWLSEAAGGMNPGFVSWAEIADDATLEAAVREKYALTGHNSIMMRRLIRKARVALCSALPAEQVAKIGLHPVSTPEQGAEWLMDHFRGRGDFTYAVVPYANVMCATLEPAGAAVAAS